jgi:hypothetical protein
MFRLPTAPNYYGGRTPVDVTANTKHQSLGAPDSRFPGWPGPMEDGRLVTDYSPHCANNIPAGSQFATKSWMQKHTDSIIQQSRKRVAKALGGTHPYDNSVVPPPTDIVKCSKSECEREPVNAPGGFGTERREPLNFELFGTYSFAPFPAPKKNVGVTSLEEGGRNTRRG